jgi:hypothetical protein
VGTLSWLKQSQALLYSALVWAWRKIEASYIEAGSATAE